MWLLIAAGVLVISIVVALLACGADFSKCKSRLGKSHGCGHVWQGLMK
jgi:hypothetical protein